MADPHARLTRELAELRVQLDLLARRVRRQGAVLDQLGLGTVPTNAPIGLRANVESIATVVGREFNVPPVALLGPTRMRPIMLPRKLLTLLSYELLRPSYAELARAMGRDHSTVMWAVSEAREAVAASPDLANRLEEMRETCRIALTSPTTSDAEAA